MQFELPGPWTLPVVGFEIQAVTFTGTVQVVAFAFGGEKCAITLIGAFELREPDGRVHSLNASSQAWERLVVLLSLRHDTIAVATVTADSNVVVELASGRAIVAGPNERYENWEISGPGEIDLLAAVGGGDPRWGH